MDELIVDKKRDFIPASPILWAYDPFIAAFTRESTWRRALLEQLKPGNPDTIADLGCGTGSFLAFVGRQAPNSKLIGIDPDAAVLAKARAKLESAGVQVELRQGYVKDAARLLAGAGVNKIVSSLVFHHLTIGEKRAAMEAFFAALPAGGELHIADFTMRLVYRIIEAFAGDGNTRVNGDILPRLMGEAGFVAVRETRVIPTVIGSISLYCGTCPPNLLACREASERAYEMPPRASVDGMDPKVREANEQQLRVCFIPPQCNFTIRRVTANARRVRQARSIGKISPQVRQPDLIPKNSSSQTFRSTTLTRVESSTNGYAITEFAYQQGS